jgi:uncharacterized surface protein with fasciclin (FAS1) repeats
MKAKTFVTIMISLCTPLAFAGYGGNYQSDKTVVDHLVSPPKFETLTAAVEAAGLLDTLQGEGPFTIFAPTDEAFASLPEGTVADLLKPENRETLVSILTYHVVAGKVAAADVSPGMVETVNGASAEITVENGTVKIDGARIIATDLTGSNGVIHIIDAVILP